MPKGIYKRIIGINCGFVKGKHWKVKDTSKMKGHITWNKGLKGIMPPPWNKGLKGVPRLGNPENWKHTEKTKQKIREMKLKNPQRYWLGKKRSEQDKTKMRKKHRPLTDLEKKQRSETSLRLGLRPPIQKGSDNINWQGGKSFEEYTQDWTQTLKRAIRQRDNYECQICGKFQSNLDKIEFCVHHINYDKKNCDPKNLITLCRKCHMKTNHRRDYWEKYFKGVDIIN